LNDLPDRLGELDRNKTIVKMCPHYDRAEIAPLDLTMGWFNVRYLTSGMLGIADAFRGDKTPDYVMRRWFRACSGTPIFGDGIALESGQAHRPVHF